MYIALALVLATFGLVFLADEDDDDDVTGNEIRGSEEDDDVTGTEGNDTILTWAGNDTIDAGAGDDEIRPGEGDDIVRAGDGRDWIVGSPGNDELYGQVGGDRVFGGTGDDIIDGGYGSDRLGGQDGDDTIFGGYDAREEDGELVPALNSTDHISGGDGDDTIYIWGGDGIARGDDGEDDLVLVTGAATLEAGAGAGDDFYVLANVTDEQLTEAIIEDFDPSRDTLTLTVDHVPAGGTLPDVDVTMTETQVDGVSGVMVEAVYTGPGDIPEETEGAVAFLKGVTIDLLDGANISVETTDQADLFDAEATMAQLAG
ncbi:calcium-binding protein [Yoonia maritima]|uniref:calcium-binding protein n=1 Tax=Yoonia maritima TaxID=1435347 RepID=UPI0013A5FDEB|nr:calcium-binding protein [Yoonia maritima]